MHVPLWAGAKAADLWTSSFLSGPLGAEWAYANAGNHTYVDSSGVLQTAAAGVAARDFDPVTLEARGIGIWQQVTNCIRNPRCEGAVPGTPGTLPTYWSQSNSSGIVPSVVAFGTESGIPYIDLRFSGSPAGVTQTNVFWETSGGASAGNAQTWTETLFLSLSAGVFTNVIATTIYTLDDGNTGGAGQNLNISAPVSAALATQKKVATFTTHSAAVTKFTNLGLAITFAGGAVDFTLRIGAPSLTQTAFVPPIILPPIGSPAVSTRAGDSLALTPAGFAAHVSPVAYAAYVDANIPGGNVANWRAIIQVDDGGSNSEGLYVNSAGPIVPVGTSGGGSSPGSYVPGATFRSSLRVSAAGTVLNAGLNGSSAGSLATGAVAATNLRLGNIPSGTEGLNGFFRQITIQKGAVNDNEFQARSFLGRQYDFTTALSADWTLTRASNASVWQAGVLTTVAANVAAIDQDPATQQPLGIGMWGQLTNLFLNSQAPVTQSVSTTAQAYTLSFYGTGSIVLSGTSTGTVTGTGALILTQSTFTPSAGALTLTCSGSLSNVQLVAGSVAGPRIITAGAAATRAADSCVLTPAAFAKYVNPAGGTAFVDQISPSLAATTPSVIQFDDGTNNNRIMLQSNVSGQVRGVTFVAGAPYTTAGVGTIPTGTPWRSALNWSASNVGAAASGAYGAATLSIPSGINTLRLGNNVGFTSAVNDYISMVAIYTNPMPAAQFQAASNTGAALP